MKNLLSAASLITALALAFALAAAAEFAGLVSFRYVDVAGFIGGCAATGVLAIALGDYTRKPSVRWQRTRQTVARAEPVAALPPIIGKAVWTRHPISA